MPQRAQFTDGHNETQSETVTYPRSHSKAVAELKVEHRFLDCLPRAPARALLPQSICAKEQVNSGWAGCQGTSVWLQPSLPGAREGEG